ncbi:8-oxo-dGTP diphosphatase [Paenibacillus soyae]|uniref:8-oxo-dGTP diphosphatase n=1 Tax=Paenibacillus soyae TaxID=2969249 RepID=A0A9X2MUD0_9BACL|nr:8-oxo-dGTP diphosphatase [Paenibacillus soyae]MCR2806670.1 8-oxo-dGTP diphosphatase [Paenibacillus soyae]
MAKQQCGIYTMCIIQDGDKVLLVNRPDSKGFPGYLGPGGKVELTESITAGAVREVKEETGLNVLPEHLVYKGVDEYVVPETNYRYMVFNYVAQQFSGELLHNPPEGELVWVDVNEALQLPMQPWFRRRFPLFFEAGTFEISVVWDESRQCAIEDKVTRLG